MAVYAIVADWSRRPPSAKSLISPQFLLITHQLNEFLTKIMTYPTSLINHPQAHTLIELIAPFVCTSLENALTFETALKGKNFDFTSEIARHGYRRIWRNAPKEILNFARKRYHMEYPIPIEYLNEVYRTVLKRPELPTTSAKDKLCYFIKQLMMDKKVIKKHTFDCQVSSCDVYPIDVDSLGLEEDRYDTEYTDEYTLEGIDDNEKNVNSDISDEEILENILTDIVERWCNIFHRLSFLLGKDLRANKTVLRTFRVTENERLGRLNVALRAAPVYLFHEVDVSQEYIVDGFGTVQDVVDEATELYFLAEHEHYVEDDREEVKMEALKNLLETSTEPLFLPPTLAKKYGQYLKGEKIVNKRLEYLAEKFVERTRLIKEQIKRSQERQLKEYEQRCLAFEAQQCIQRCIAIATRDVHDHSMPHSVSVSF